jgi:3',5'-cyclic AMP phosphodiesterase CpdA
MSTLAHITDLHVAPLPPVTWRQIANKRVLGYVSWHRKRKHEHCAGVLDALCRDLAQQAPDHVCVTGDVTNLGLAAEYARAPDWFARLGPPERVSVIRGNHDAYVAMPHGDTAAHWTPWLAGDDGATAPPTLRRRGAVSLIGVDTALPTPPFMASGRVGRAQAERLDALLAQEGVAGQVRVVLLHHPPQPGVVGRRKGLHDAPRVRAVLAARGAELVLHGHMHAPMTAELPGPTGPIPVYGAGSASSAGTRRMPPAQYHLVTVTQDARGLRLDVTGRCYDPARAAFGPAATDTPAPFAA